MNASSGSISGSLKHVLEDIWHSASTSSHNPRLKFINLTNELYRGITPNIVGNAISWSSYFMLYEFFKQTTRHHKQLDDSKNLETREILLCGCAAGLTTSFFTNPIWVLKTRMLSTSNKTPGAYSSMTDGILRIVKEEGITGFWRGLTPSLIGVGHGTIQITLYDKIKIFQQERKGYSNSDPLSTLEYTVASATSKVSSTLIMYPFQVLRSRMQNYTSSNQHQNLVNTALQIFKKEGMLGFYKGMVPNLLRMVPSTSMTFVVYEKVKEALS